MIVFISNQLDEAVKVLVDDLKSLDSAFKLTASELPFQILASSIPQVKQYYHNTLMKYHGHFKF